MSALYLRANKSFERDLRETSYLQQDKVPAPDNIKASLNTQIKKIEYAFINVKSLMVAHENFFSDDNQNITEVYVSELNDNISIYGLIAILGKTNNKDNKLHLTMPEHKVKFNLQKDAYKNKIVLKLGKFHTKTCTQRDVLIFDILRTKRNKTIGEKRTTSREIDTAHVLGFQNFDDHARLNPIEITINLSKIIKVLSSYKKYKFRFIIII